MANNGSRGRWRRRITKREKKRWWWWRRGWCWWDERVNACRIGIVDEKFFRAIGLIDLQICNIISRIWAGKSAIGAIVLHNLIRMADKNPFSSNLHIKNYCWYCYCTDWIISGSIVESCLVINSNTIIISRCSNFRIY